VFLTLKPTIFISLICLLVFVNTEHADFCCERLRFAIAVIGFVNWEGALGLGDLRELPPGGLRELPPGDLREIRARVHKILQENYD
jgi:hypothetical protein